MIEINGHKIDPEHYVKKWTNWALEETEATDEQVIENVQWLYKKASLNQPEVKVFRDYEEFLSTDWASVRASVGASVRDSVRDSVRASVRDSVWASVGDSVGDSVWDSVGDSVRASVRDSVWASVGAWYWADDMAFADVFVDTNILSKEKANELKKIKDILSTQRIAIFTEKICYVLVAPKIRRNEQGLLHSDEFLAVDWKGTGIHYLNGVRFPKELWEKVVSRKMPFEEILAIEDIDQRTQAMRYGDVEKFLEHTRAEKLNESKKGNRLYKIPQGDVFTTDAYYLVYSCPSTSKLYMSGVTKEVGEKKDADFAQAWKHNMTISQYMTLEPLVTES